MQPRRKPRLTAPDVVPPPDQWDRVIISTKHTFKEPQFEKLNEVLPPMAPKAAPPKARFDPFDYAWLLTLLLPLVGFLNLRTLALTYPVRGGFSPEVAYDQNVVFYYSICIALVIVLVLHGLSRQFNPKHADRMLVGLGLGLILVGPVWNYCFMNRVQLNHTLFDFSGRNPGHLTSEVADLRYTYAQKFLTARAFFAYRNGTDVAQTPGHDIKEIREYKTKLLLGQWSASDLGDDNNPFNITLTDVEQGAWDDERALTVATTYLCVVAFNLPILPRPQIAGFKPDPDRAALRAAYQYICLFRRQTLPQVTALYQQADLQFARDNPEDHSLEAPVLPEATYHAPSKVANSIKSGLRALGLRAAALPKPVEIQVFEVITPEGIKHKVLAPSQEAAEALVITQP